MMRTKGSFWVFVLGAMLQTATSLPAETEGQKRVLAENAFSNDFNKCLFTAWTTASGNPNAVLSSPVDCPGVAGSTVQLCYGLQPPTAQFAVCYNKNTLIPDFTAHIVRPGIVGGGRDTDWREDTGKFAPVPQATVADYDPYGQAGLYDNYNIPNQYYCSKGHLTPNADFSTDAERSLTMITTNIAPQWQKFNSMNWAELERALRTYAQRNQRNLYVFTGVGGKARNLRGQIIQMNRRVLAPRWYWKAVCDPVAKQSIVFVGANSVGDASNSRVPGCNNIQQTKDRGVIYCFSLSDALKGHKQADFKLPPFNENCQPSVKGTFMDNFLNALGQ